MADAMVYDDVAFFWFIMTILFVVLVPLTYQFVAELLHRDEGVEVAITSVDKKKWKQFQQEQLKKKKNVVFRFKFLIYGALVVAFAYGLTKIPEYQTEELATFDPYDILGLTSGATEQEIKRAYRRLSVQLHPDKNPGDPKAANKFMLLAKAHMTLTDDATRENWEKYGNPDGYQGIQSFTIGLPSAILDESNHLPILILYFVVIVIIPPVVIGIWWQNQKNVHESGVILDSIGLFWHFLNEDASFKSRLKVLCYARELDPFRMFSSQRKKYPAILDDGAKMTKLHEREMPRLKDDEPAQMKVAVAMMTTHLMRATDRLSPESNEYIKRALQSTHKLIGAMIGVDFAKHRRWELLRSIMHVSQRLVQAIPNDESCLLQLPLSPTELTKLKRAKQLGKDKTLANFLHLTPEERREALRLDETNAEAKHKEIESLCEFLPDPHVDISWDVEDEKGLFQGDVVSLKAYIERKASPETLKQVAEQQRKAEEREERKVNRLRVTNEKSSAKKKKKFSRKKSKGPTEADTGTELARVEETEEEEEEEDGEDGEDKEEEDEMSDDERMFEEMKRRRDVRRKNRYMAPVVAHAPFFPDKKYERWLVTLTDINGNLLDMRRITSLRHPQEVEFKVLMSQAHAKWRVHLVPDSYVGLDRQAEISLHAKPRPKEEEQAQMALEGDEERTAFDEIAQDEEASPLWYTILDYTLQAIILAVVGFGLYSYYSQKPWFQANIEPTIQRVLTTIEPITSRLGVLFGPLISLWQEHIAPLLVVDNAPQTAPDPSKSAYWRKREL